MSDTDTDRPTREQVDALRTELRTALDEVDHPNRITVDQDALIEILDRLDEQGAGHAAEVPARLDAVRRWVRDVQATDWTVLPDSAVPAFAAAVRDVARIVDEPWDVAAAALSDDPAALRAAVAAALARPTGGQA